MSFAQLEYLPFLVLVVAAFQFLPRTARVPFLLLASLVFYSHDEPSYLILLAISTLLDYGVGLGLERWEEAGRRRALLACSVTGNLVLLALFKYANVTWVDAAPAQGDVGMLELARPIGLPLGISFYTFQTLGYAIDVYRRRIPACRSLVEYALYVAFFPQLVSGPIERAGHLLPQLRRVRRLTLDNASLGACWILWGLCKKLVLADRFRPVLLAVFRAPGEHDSVTLLVADLALMVVLYLDFSAYIDMARGSALLFGVRLVPNFRTPFLAWSVGEFVRRWHVSLMEWVRDYLYLPLLRGRPTPGRIACVNVLVMGLVGLWHGARWTCVLGWLSAGIVLTAEQSLRRRARRAGRLRVQSGARRACAGWVWTMFYLSFFAVAFYSPDLESASVHLSSVCTGGLPDGEALAFVGRVLALLALGLAVHAAGAIEQLGKLWAGAGAPVRVAAIVALAVLVLRYQVPVQDFDYFRF